MLTTVYPSGSASTDTSAVQSAINSTVAAGGGVVRLAAGRFKLNSTVTITGTGVTVEGENQGATQVEIQMTSGDVFAVGSPSVTASRVTIKDMLFDRPAGYTATGGAVIKAMNYRNFFIRGVEVWGRNYRGIELNGQGMPYIALLENIDINDCSNDGVVITGADSSHLVQEVWIKSGNVAGCRYGVNIENGSGIYMEGTSLLINKNAAVALTPGQGQRAKAVRMSQIIMDSTTDGHGLLVDGAGMVVHIHLTNCWAATNSVHGVLLDGDDMKDILIQGGTFTNNGLDGICVMRGKAINVVGVTACGNGLVSIKHGIEFAQGCKDFSVLNCFAGDYGEVPNSSQYYGIWLNGGHQNYIVMGNQTRGNAGGGILDAGGTNKVITHNL